MDGTAELFKSFVAAAPPAFPVRPLPLPNERPRSYGELSDWVLTQLPPEPIALIAESFSGPLALLVADRCPRVTAVVLCASFVEAPLPGVFAGMASVVWNRPLPLALLRMFLAGGDRILAEAVRRAVASVNANVIAARIGAVLRVNVTAELERFTRPLMFLSAEQDRIIPSRSVKRARALKPSAHFASVEAPHLVLQARPTESWHHIGPFLEKSNVRGAG